MWKEETGENPLSKQLRLRTSARNLFIFLSIEGGVAIPHRCADDEVGLRLC